MKRDFQQIEWNAAAEAECRRIVQWAVREDLDRQQDWTTVALVPPDAMGCAAIAARRAGVVAGMSAVRVALAEMESQIEMTEALADGSAIKAGSRLAILSGPARSLLTCERLLLNLLGRLSGIATLTRQYVEAVAGTKARIYDTRKTTPGWRRLEKYAVRCGGGFNHRLGLFDAVLIKDNHLVVGAEARGGEHFTPSEAVRRAREMLANAFPNRTEPLIVEVEVDTLDQLREVLPERPDLVLLDNMSLADLRASVALRNSSAPNRRTRGLRGHSTGNRRRHRPHRRRSHQRRRPDAFGGVSGHWARLAVSLYVAQAFMRIYAWDIAKSAHILSAPFTGLWFDDSLTLRNRIDEIQGALAAKAGCRTVKPRKRGSESAPKGNAIPGIKCLGYIKASRSGTVVSSTDRDDRRAESDLASGAAASSRRAYQSANSWKTARHVGP